MHDTITCHHKQFFNTSVFVLQNDTNIFSVSLKFWAYYATGQPGKFIIKCYLMLTYTLTFVVTVVVTVVVVVVFHH